MDLDKLKQFIGIKRTTITKREKLSMPEIDNSIVNIGIVLDILNMPEPQRNNYSVCWEAKIVSLLEKAKSDLIKYQVEKYCE